MRDVAAMLSEIRQEREESTKGVENNGCSGSCNNNGGERIYDSSPSSAVQQTAKYLRNSSKSFSASVFDVLFFLLLLVMLEQM